MSKYAENMCIYVFVCVWDIEDKENLGERDQF